MNNIIRGSDSHEGAEQSPDRPIEFASPLLFPKGTISTLLKESYSPLMEAEGLDWKKFSADFDNFDEEVHSDERVARCVFISTLDGKPIGLGSFDPRQGPAYADVGHNCILPSCKGKGFGKKQMMEILRQLKERGIQTARVSTGTEDFFEPARRMYEACGFQKTRTFKLDKYPYGEMIEYEQILSSR